MNDSNGGVKGTVINKSTSIVINSMQKKRSQETKHRGLSLKEGGEGRPHRGGDV